MHSSSFSFWSSKSRSPKVPSFDFDLKVWLCRPARLPPPMQDGGPSVCRRFFSRQAVTSAPFHIVGEIAHRLLRNDAALASGERCLRFVNGGEDLSTRSLALFP